MRSRSFTLSWVKLSSAVCFLAWTCLLSGCENESVPKLTTDEVTELYTVTPVTGGTIASDGGSAIISQGVVWDIKPGPQFDLPTKTSDKLVGRSFRSTLPTLKVVTTYYVRAYARNAKGVGYGDEKMFVTPADAPSISLASITRTSTSTAIVSFDVISNNGADVTALEVDWTSDQNVFPNYDLTNKTGPKPSMDVYPPGNYIFEITGLSSGIIYYYRYLATNSAGTIYSGLSKIP